VPEDRLVARGEYDLIRDLDMPPAPGPSGCGAQALATVIAHYDPSVESKETADQLPWKDKGATPIAILLTTRGLGYSARILPGEWEYLRETVDTGIPVLVMFDRASRTTLPLLPKRRPSYHWGVVSGMAKDGSGLLIAAPDHSHYVIGRDLFVRRWEATDRCTIEVRPDPDRSGAGKVRAGH